MSDRGGHVFVVRGDVTAIACDAWLVPTDEELHVEPYWHRALELDSRPLPTKADRTKPVVPVDWPHPSRRPFLVDVVHPETRVDNARRFLEAAKASLGEPFQHRAKHLVALPLIGTGGGGAREVAGKVVESLLPVLQRGARELDLDVALVLDKPDAFAAAQKVRLALSDPFPALDEDLLAQADALAQLARDGKLVLFLGAGTGRAAGLPLWREMLRNLAAEAGFDERARQRLKRLPPLDQAQLLAQTFEERGERLLDAVVRQVEAAHYSITHALLASLPVREVVTTNYDDLFERAWAARGADYSVLPHGPRAPGERFILKLHGCVTAAEHIVLTRDDYLRYVGERAALLGIVQALLLTRHLLFVGSSLEDDNFHRIVHEVRKAEALGRSRDRRFGTVLELVARPFSRELWRDLDWVSFEGENDGEDLREATARAARKLEIFLDRLCARATSSSEYLLSVGYHGADEAEERLRMRLLELLDDATLHDADAWSEVEQLAARLGHPRARAKSLQPLQRDTADPLETAIDAAKIAGDMLRREFHRRGGPRGRGDKAHIDAIVERAIRKRIARDFPNDGFQGEETAPEPPREKTFWCVDPNDGTRAFLKGDRGSAVSIARIVDGVPVLGVVFAPLYPDDDGELFAWAEGAPLTRNGAPIERPPLPEELGSLEIVGTSRGAERSARAHLQCIAPSRFRAVPSLAHRIAMVASGDVDAAVAIDRPNAWDVAGGHALVRGALGDLYDESGEPLRYAPYRPPRRAIAGSPEAAAALHAREWNRIRTGRSDPPAHATFSTPRFAVSGEAFGDAKVLARAQGCLLGLLSGDALGQLVEFASKKEIAKRYPDGVRELEDGGTFRLMAGQPTDDGELALLLARSIDREGEPRHEAILQAYREWVEDAFDVGRTIGAALRGRVDPESQANGSLMRVAPIALYAHAFPPDEIARLAREESARTHVHPVCRDACAVYCVAVAHAIRTGAPSHEVFEVARAWARGAEIDRAVLETIDAAEREPPADYERHAGWVRVALQNAFHRLLHARSFTDALAATIAEGGDTDTNAAIAGALLGAVQGREAIPIMYRRAILTCRPVAGVAHTEQPRPRELWPVDALVLAERLLLAGARRR